MPAQQEITMLKSCKMTSQLKPLPVKRFIQKVTPHMPAVKNQSMYQRGSSFSMYATPTASALSGAPYFPHAKGASPTEIRLPAASISNFIVVYPTNSHYTIFFAYCNHLSLYFCISSQNMTLHTPKRHSDLHQHRRGSNAFFRL